MPQALVDEHGRVAVMVRLPRDLVKRVDHLRIDLQLTRARMIEQLLREGLTALDDET